MARTKYSECRCFAEPEPDKHHLREGSVHRNHGNNGRDVLQVSSGGAKLLDEFRQLAERCRPHTNADRMSSDQLQFAVPVHSTQFGLRPANVVRVCSSSDRSRGTGQ